MRNFPLISLTGFFEDVFMHSETLRDFSDGLEFLSLLIFICFSIIEIRLFLETIFFERIFLNGIVWKILIFICGLFQFVRFWIFCSSSIRISEIFDRITDSIFHSVHENAKFHYFVLDLLNLFVVSFTIECFAFVFLPYLILRSGNVINFKVYFENVQYPLDRTESYFAMYFSSLIIPAILTIIFLFCRFVLILLNLVRMLFFLTRNRRVRINLFPCFKRFLFQPIPKWNTLSCNLNNFYFSILAIPQYRDSLYLTSLFSYTHPNFIHQNGRRVLFTSFDGPCSF